MGVLVKQHLTQHHLTAQRGVFDSDLVTKRSDGIAIDAEVLEVTKSLEVGKQMLHFCCQRRWRQELDSSRNVVLEVASQVALEHV